MTTAGNADCISIYSNGWAPVAPVIDLNSVISRYLSVKRQCLSRIIIKMFFKKFAISGLKTFWASRIHQLFYIEPFLVCCGVKKAPRIVPILTSSTQISLKSLLSSLMDLISQNFRFTTVAHSPCARVQSSFTHWCLKSKESQFNATFTQPDFVSVLPSLKY